MKWEQYRERAAEFAVYPGAGTGSPLAKEYAVVGYLSELGEVAAIMKRVIRDGGSESGMKAELGDVFWYVAAMDREGVHPHMPLTPELRALLSACGVEGAPVVDYAKWRVSRMCTGLGLTEAEVLEANIAKLTDRAARGVLKGKGDNR